MNIDDEQLLILDVLDSDYAPDNNATIDCSIKTPSGETETLTFTNSTRVDGRYTAQFTPADLGVYKIFVKAESKAEKQFKETEFMVVSSHSERQLAAMEEQKLKALAMASEGTYWNYQEINKISEIPFTRELNYIEEKIAWRQSWIFLIFILMAILPDWFLRRRIGLK